MIDASICGLGQAAPNPIACVFKYFPHELTEERPMNAPHETFVADEAIVFSLNGSRRCRRAGRDDHRSR
jgi:hypothetical protein